MKLQDSTVLANHSTWSSNSAIEFGGDHQGAGVIDADLFQARDLLA